MRYSLIELSPKRGLTAAEAGSYIGCQAWFDAALKAGWLKPVCRGKERRYDVQDVDSVWERIKADEWPEP